MVHIGGDLCSAVDYDRLIMMMLTIDMFVFQIMNAL